MTNKATQRIIATHHIDAEGKVLGRLATQIAVLLRGKIKLALPSIKITAIK